VTKRGNEIACSVSRVIWPMRRADSPKSGWSASARATAAASICACAARSSAMQSAASWPTRTIACASSRRSVAASDW